MSIDMSQSWNLGISDCGSGSGKYWCRPPERDGFPITNYVYDHLTSGRRLTFYEVPGSSSITINP